MLTLSPLVNPPDLADLAEPERFSSHRVGSEERRGITHPLVGRLHLQHLQLASVVTRDHHRIT
eukprot:3899871-Rhodomonas_salina.3